MIVFSRVLKFRALFIAIGLLLTLTFFQSNQALDELSAQSNSEASTAPPSGTLETPSIFKASLESSNNYSSNFGPSTGGTNISISIKSSTSNNSSEGDQEKEITIQEIERELTDGSINLSFKTNGEDQDIDEDIDNEDGKISIDFESDYDHDSENEVKTKIKISKNLRTKN